MEQPNTIDQPSPIVFITSNNIILPLNDIILNIKYNILFEYFIDFIDIVLCFVIFILIIDKILQLLYTFAIIYNCNK
jgi:hypothetical protein